MDSHPWSSGESLTKGAPAARFAFALDISAIVKWVTSMLIIMRRKKIQGGKEWECAVNQTGDEALIVAIRLA